MIQPRDYQENLLTAAIREIFEYQHNDVLLVCPTGGGKTVIFSELIKRLSVPTCAIAHRQELVGQMSITLARYGIAHNIIAPDDIIKRVIKRHVRETGTSYYSKNSPVAVAGVDTIVRRKNELTQWLPRVKLVITDEAHHVLRDNKWGEALLMFPNAAGLGVTATPERADGKGLGRHAAGVFDSMVIGPTMRELINDGYLTDYRIYCPPSDIDLSDVTIGKDGDYTKKKLKNAVRRSHIIGDVVTHYQKICPGKLAVVFASDVETAKDISNKFNMANVPAAIVHAGTPDDDRAATLDRFARRELLVLVNVDLFGEGFDLPAIEVVIMARPTQSYALYCQQFGRALRLMVDISNCRTREERLTAIASSSKPVAIIIDHVGNVTNPRLGLPDKYREWTLNNRERTTRGKNEDDDEIPLRACLNVTCMQVYERVLPECPYCGHHPVPASRKAPEFVDGDLTELDAETLAAMRGEVMKIDMPADEYREELRRKHCPEIAQHANVKRHLEKQETQRELRDTIALWAGYHKDMGRTDAESYRRFYFKFNIDVLSAQALDIKDAKALNEKVNEDIIFNLWDQKNATG